MKPSNSTVNIYEESVERELRVKKSPPWGRPFRGFKGRPGCSGPRTLVGSHGQGVTEVLRQS